MEKLFYLEVFVVVLFTRGEHLFIILSFCYIFDYKLEGMSLLLFVCYAQRKVNKSFVML